MLAKAAEVDASQRDAAVDFFDFFSLHERFHRRLAECAGCPALVEAVVKTNTLIRTWQYAAISDFREMPPDYHNRLMLALLEGNAEDADRAMRAHVRHGMDEVLRRMERYLHAEGA